MYFSLQNYVLRYCKTQTTFYNHFSDKFDIMPWHIDYKITNLGKHVDNYQQYQIPIIKEISENKKLIKKAFTTTGQNSFKHHATKGQFNFYVKQLEQKNIQCDEYDLFAIELYCIGATEMIEHYVNENHKDYKELINKFNHAKPNILKELDE